MKNKKQLMGADKSKSSPELLLKLDRIEAEIEVLRVPILLNNKQIAKIKEKLEFIQELIYNRT